MLDRQPGAAPDVRREGDSITFLLEVAGAPERIKLVLRCTQTDIFASVANVREQGPAIGEQGSGTVM